MKKKQLRQQIKELQRQVRKSKRAQASMLGLDVAHLQGMHDALSGKDIYDNPFTGVARREMWANGFKNQTMSLLGSQALLAVIRLHQVYDDLRLISPAVLDAVIREALYREEDEPTDEEECDETPTDQEPEDANWSRPVHPRYHDYCD